MQKLLVAFLAVADASRLRAPVFDPLQSVAPLSLDEGALDNATAPPVDRVFEYPKDFRLDEPFTLSLSSHESVLVPLEPILSKLFGNSNAGSTAIGFELSTCQGKVLTTITMQDGSSRRLSSADYQCATMVKTPSTVPIDLCPIVRGDRDIAIHKDPTQVKGFIVRAYESAEVVALLRTTKDKGAYNSAFFLAADPVEADASRRLNVSFTAKSTQLAFESAHTWRPSDNTTSNSICLDCEFALYAQMAAPPNNSDLLPRAPPPPYCLSSRDSIKYTLPTVSSSASQHVTLPSGFGDLFSTSGEYSFVLVASMPASSNNGHPAYFTYAPARVTVAAPTHYVSHILAMVGVIAVVAFLFFVAIKSELPRRLMALRSKPEVAPHNEESVKLLARVIAEQDAHDAAGGHEDSDEEHKSESLLDVIRKTKAQESTPQPSPRHPQAAQLEGYHEIN